MGKQCTGMVQCKQTWHAGNRVTQLCMHPANRSSGAMQTTMWIQVVDLTADTASHDDDDVVVVGIKPGLRPLRSLIKRTRPAAPPGQQPMHTAQHGQQAPQAHALPAGAWPAWLPPVAAQPVAPTRPSSPDSRKCAICLEKMEQMASTPCGCVTGLSSRQCSCNLTVALWQASACH